jgi:predicted transposase YbfD/YdcC
MATIKVSLWDCLGSIPDPRATSGRRFSLQSILGVIIAATIAGCNSVRSAARWASKLSTEELKLLGVTRKKAPTQTTMHSLLCRLDADAVESAFSLWVSSFACDDDLLHIAIDGKILKGSRTAEYPALHLLAAYCANYNSVVQQKAVDIGKNEITTAKEMLFDMPLKGKFITGDAIFCQKEVCNIVFKNSGDYIFIVKRNQKQLLEDIKLAFKKNFFSLYVQDKDGRVRKH